MIITMTKLTRTAGTPSIDMTETTDSDSVRATAGDLADGVFEELDFGRPEQVVGIAVAQLSELAPTPSEEKPPFGSDGGRVEVASRSSADFEASDIEITRSVAILAVAETEQPVLAFTPNVQFAHSTDGHGVAPATDDGLDVGEGGDALGGGAIEVVAQAQAAVAAATPGVDVAATIAGQCVGAPAGDSGDVDHVEAQHQGRGGQGHRFADLAVAQLAVRAGAPGVDAAFVGEHHGVVSAGAHVDAATARLQGADQRHALDQPWLGLRAQVWRAQLPQFVFSPAKHVALRDDRAVFVPHSHPLG